MSPAPPLHFDTLPDDILLSISRRLATPSEPIFARSIMRIEEITLDVVGGHSSLVPLSMTCTRLRALYVPLIFRAVSLSAGENAGERNLPSPRIAFHVQILRVEGSYLIELDALRSLFPNLREVYCTGELCYSPFTHPGLETISLHSPTLHPDLALNPIIGASLRSFRLLVDPRWTRLGNDAEEIDDTERNLVVSVLGQVRPTLEHVVLPGESAPLSLLASALWPCLRELALYGAHPGALSETPIVFLLSMMPNLRVLTLAIAPRRCDPPLLIWPPNPSISVEIPRGLERVTIAFPHAEDLFFAHLPAGLIELSLRDTPRFYRRVRPPHPNPGAAWLARYERPRDVGYHYSPRRIFAAIPDCSGLRRLELVVQAPNTSEFLLEEQMYVALARACPCLRFLELHRYCTARPPNWHTDGLPIPIDAIASSLSALSELRELRLNLDVPPGCDAYGRPIEWEASLILAENTAGRFAAALPSLETIALLDTSRTHLPHWRTWSVLARSASCGVELREDAENSTVDWDR